MNDRRRFFRQVAGKSAELVLKEARQRANARAEHWIRPPYAVEEVEFLLACTRCDSCVSACPHDVIFMLPARVGITAAGTPAMDLNQKACQLCQGWPCVTACEADALVLPVPADADGSGREHEIPLPRIAQCWVDTGRCLPYSGPECGACKGICPVEGALQWDDFERPSIVTELCIGCAACRAACIMEPSAIGVRSRLAAAE
jgi:ferredoxin-type protein NapG